MNEEITTITDVQPDVKKEKEYVDYSEKSLSEILDIFSGMLEAEDHHDLYKNAEPLKAAFYKNLKKERAAAMASEGSEGNLSSDNSENGDAVTARTVPFIDEERRFKEMYARYKADRAEYNARNEKAMEENLSKKLDIIDKIKNIIEKGDVSHTSFTEFRALQQEWRDAGPIPNSRYKEVYETYQHTVEMFYDLVSIDRELRDLDFKKNLEVKTRFCEMAEKLADNKNVVEAFRALQKLHEEWKEFGPVAKEYRESIWERFKAATSVINKKYQAYFEEQKAKFRANLEAKTALCEKAEEIMNTAIESAKDWSKYSDAMENLQQEWKKIGPVAKKDSQKIYDRFRAACNRFFDSRKEYYSKFRDEMQENYQKKLAICEQAESMMNSEDWKATTEFFVNLQKQWKEIGPVSRKRAEQLWKRFRSACDTFFDNRNAKSDDPSITLYQNLKSKKALVKEVKEYVLSGNQEDDAAAMKDFIERWNAIGYVPMRDKEKINNAFKAALAEKFPSAEKEFRRNRPQARKQVAPVSEKERLIQLYNKKEAELATYENNIGFLSQSSGGLIKQLQDQIETLKAELAKLEGQIRELEQKENSEE
ncbi:MAG: DUF349 domain-containing protein [Bacteroidetes bacterium]|uniref:DUF349 domain-containing protein n=1 Tax=Candidatus Merdivivens pullicola TaxID=2840872 RepID=A0A9D9IHB0_9BACT|nr:DUF349 domain-containing protein [Candidatus Merdivivens pullicola]